MVDDTILIDLNSQVFQRDLFALNKRNCSPTLTNLPQRRRDTETKIYPNLCVSASLRFNDLTLVNGYEQTETDCPVVDVEKDSVNDLAAGLCRCRVEMGNHSFPAGTEWATFVQLPNRSGLPGCSLSRGTVAQIAESASQSRFRLPLASQNVAWMKRSLRSVIQVAPGHFHNRPGPTDILLLRREQPRWNEAQRQRLADGLRDTDASHLLIEFKYTEGLSENACVQLLSYDYFYRRHRRLPRDDVACFLVSATTPRSDLLTRLGFHPTDRAGVYGRNDHPLLEAMQVILLNELTPAAHNVFLKCFASRRKEQEVSFRVLQHNELLGSSVRIERLIYGLWRLLMKNAPEIQEITPEYVMQLGQELIDAVLEATPPDKVMKHFTAEERLAGLTPDQIRRYLEQLEKSNPQ